MGEACKTALSTLPSSTRREFCRRPECARAECPCEDPDLLDRADRADRADWGPRAARRGRVGREDRADLLFPLVLLAPPALLTLLVLPALLLPLARLAPPLLPSHLRGAAPEAAWG